MRAWVIRETGSLERVVLEDVPAPQVDELRPTDVRVALRAAALNHLDLFVVRGLRHEYRFPHVLGADGAGVVDAVGEAVVGVRPGDAVMINPAVSDGVCRHCLAGEHSLCENLRVLGEHLPGTLAEYVVVPEHNVARIPRLSPPLEWAEAAAFSLAALTAWRMVVTRAALRPGETVLIWGIGGAVSQAALQIATLWNARTIVTSSDERKLQRARELGADVLLDHGRADLLDEVRRLTGNRGVDVVIDSVGEATWERSLRALARGGRLVTCGATSGPHVTIDVRRLFWKQFTLLGSTLGSASEYAAALAMLARGKLRPAIDRVYPFAEAPAALARLSRHEQFGKIAVVHGPVASP